MRSHDSANALNERQTEHDQSNRLVLSNGTSVFDGLDMLGVGTCCFQSVHDKGKGDDCQDNGQRIEGAVHFEPQSLDCKEREHRQ